MVSRDPVDPWRREANEDTAISRPQLVLPPAAPSPSPSTNDWMPANPCHSLWPIDATVVPPIAESKSLHFTSRVRLASKSTSNVH